MFNQEGASLGSHDPVPNRPEPAQEEIGFWIQQLQTGDFQIRWEAAKQLGCSGEGGLELLVNLVVLEHLQAEIAEDGEDFDWEFPWFVARILGHFSHPQAIEALAQLIQVQNFPEIPSAAAAALAQIGIPALPTLETLMARAETKLVATQAIAQIGDPLIVDLLLDQWQDSDPQIRVVAIQALSGFLDKRIPPYFQLALRDPAPQVREAAIIGCGLRVNQLDPLEIEALIIPMLEDLNLAVARQAAIALGRLGKQGGKQSGSQLAVLALARGLTSAYPLALQLEIIRSLGQIASPAALGVLAQLLPWPDPEQDGGAAWGDGLDDRENAAAEESPVELSREAIVVLGRIELESSKSQAREILVNWLEHQRKQKYLAVNPELQQIAALSLGRLGQIEAIPSLVDLLGSGHSSLRLHAIAALKQISPDLALEQLDNLAQDSNLSTDLATGIKIALAEW
jgi:HEAT repeat protein